METDPVLITVPARAEDEEAIDSLLQMLVALRSTAPQATVLVVDDHSPPVHAQVIQAAAAELECAHTVLQDGEGTSAAINVGLSVAAENKMDACLIGRDLVLDSPGWLGRLQARTGTDGTQAAVAGGASVETSGLIRQAGYFFSLYRRGWVIRLNNVPEVLLDVTTPLLCPVDAEVQLVRREWIERVGLYDEMLEGAFAALDYCLRVSDAGGQCVFEPSVRARALLHVETDLDGASASARRLRHKHAGVSFQKWVPEVL